jgi:hypothetical protein
MARSVWCPVISSVQSAESRVSSVQSRLYIQGLGDMSRDLGGHLLAREVKDLLRLDKTSRNSILTDTFCRPDRTCTSSTADQAQARLVRVRDGNLLVVNCAVYQGRHESACSLGEGFEVIAPLLVPEETVVWSVHTRRSALGRGVLALEGHGVARDVHVWRKVEPPRREELFQGRDSLGNFIIFALDGRRGVEVKGDDLRLAYAVDSRVVHQTDEGAVRGYHDCAGGGGMGFGVLFRIQRAVLAPTTMAWGGALLVLGWRMLQSDV